MIVILVAQFTVGGLAAAYKDRVREEIYCSTVDKSLLIASIVPLFLGPRGDQELPSIDHFTVLFIDGKH